MVRSFWVTPYVWDGETLTRAPDRARPRKVMFPGRKQVTFRLENEAWHVLRHIANREGVSVSEICRLCDVDRVGTLGSAVHLFMLRYLLSELKNAS